MSELERSKKILDAYKQKKEAEEAKRIFDLLPQGPNSGLDADTVDGYDADELIEKCRKSIVVKAGGSGGGGGGDMFRGAYDADYDGVVDDSENTQAIDGVTLDAEAPVDGQVLVYDAGSGTWKPLDPDVTIVDVNIPAQTTTLGVTTAGESISYSDARVDTATGTANVEVVAAQGAGNRIYVCGYQIQGKGDVEAKFRSANTDISVEWDFNAREGAANPPVKFPLYYFRTAANEALNIYLDAAIRVTANVQYYVAT